MNNKIIIAIIVVVVVIGGVYIIGGRKSYQTNKQTFPAQAQKTVNKAQPSSSQSAQDAVIIQNFSFSPATITVKSGDTVTWTNKDSMGHSATADDGSFDTGIISQGQSKSITFKKPGTYTYHCSVHPYMKGTVIVK